MVFGVRWSLTRGKVNMICEDSHCHISFNVLIMYCLYWWNQYDRVCHDIDGLVQERGNSAANALELRLSWT